MNKILSISLFTSFLLVNSAFGETALQIPVLQYTGEKKTKVSPTPSHITEETYTLNGFLTFFFHGGIVDKVIIDTLGNDTRVCNGRKEIGSSIVVYDNKGSIIGVGNLKPYSFMSEGDGSGICRMKYSVENIPKTNFYQIDIANKDKKFYTFDELNQRSWNIDYDF